MSSRYRSPSRSLELLLPPLITMPAGQEVAASQPRGQGGSPAASSLQRGGSSGVSSCHKKSLFSRRTFCCHAIVPWKDADCCSKLSTGLPHCKANAPRPCRALHAAPPSLVPPVRFSLGIEAEHVVGELACGCKCRAEQGSTQGLVRPGRPWQSNTGARGQSRGWPA